MLNFLIRSEYQQPEIIRFIQENELSAIYHHPAWIKAIERTFGYNGFYLILLTSSIK